MKKNRPSAIAAGGAALAALLAAGCSPMRPAPLDASAAQSACSALAADGVLPATQINATYVPTGTARPPNAPATAPALPGHCLLRGRIDARTGADGKPYATGFELTLPDAWNGRFLYMGGGGNDGMLRSTYGVPAGVSAGTPTPLAQGYAVVSTDAGHDGTSALFGLDPQARIDHAFQSHDKAARAAKALIAQRFGRAPDRSYFVGCSGGGRQGMMFSQRFPSYFDGIVAGAPAMRVSSGATVAAMWETIRLSEIAPAEGGGRILSRAFSDADLALVARGINAACDAQDGLADGMVNNVASCRFDPAALQCAGAKTDACLSPAQVSALKAVYAGPRDSKGNSLYAGQPWDPGLVGPDWRNWKLGKSTTATPDSRHFFLMRDALIHEFFTPPDPSFDVMKFDFDRDPARMSWFSAVYDTYADDRLAEFRRRGGKLLFVHGMSDPIFSATDTIDYYARLTATNGGRQATEGFARAFLVPGMTHCTGGPATDVFDSLQAVVDWVEKGKAPERIEARALANNAWFPNRTRPLCAWPKYAKYDGRGNVEDAASFSCVEN